MFCRVTGSGPTSDRFNSALEEMRSVPRQTVPVIRDNTASHWSGSAMFVGSFAGTADAQFASGDIARSAQRRGVDMGLASQPRGRRMRRWRKHKDTGSRITAIGVEAGARSEMPADPVDPRFRRDGRVYQAERPRGAVASRSLSRCRTQQNAERARNGYKSQVRAPGSEPRASATPKLTENSNALSGATP